MKTNISKLAGIIGDYRQDDGFQVTEEHVAKWSDIFDPKVRSAILSELCIVFEKTYISKERFVGFLKELTNNAKLVVGDVEEYWSSVNFLNIQQAGSSQKDLLNIFGEALEEEHGIDIDDCGGGNHFIYIDDFMFSGGRVRSDILRWVENDSPEEATLHIIVAALHTNFWYTDKVIKSKINEIKKKITVKFWTIYTLENKKCNAKDSDVLWPSSLPELEDVKKYVDGLDSEVVLRPTGSVGKHALFSSEDSRKLIEQQMIIAGVEVLEKCQYLRKKKQMRPLGSGFFGLGFGGLMVSYRNCPNNCPLAFWAGDPWYPLFPRKIN